MGGVGRVSISTKNEVGGNYTDSQKAKMTKTATKILTKERRINEDLASAANKVASKDESKAASTDISDKKEKYLANAETERKLAESFTQRATVANTRLSEIKAGTVEAGKDYVTNTSYSTNLLLDAVGLVNVKKESTVTYK